MTKNKKSGSKSLAASQATAKAGRKLLRVRNTPHPAPRSYADALARMSVGVARDSVGRFMTTFEVAGVAARLTSAAFGLDDSHAQESERPICNALARISVQLAREDAGRFMTTSEIVDAALKLARAGFQARKAVERGARADLHYAAAQEIARAFDADVVRKGDATGMVMGVRFRTGNYRENPESVMYVT